MPIVNCIPDFWWLFYNVHETLTVIVSHVYLFYVSFACLGLGLKRGGLDLGLGLGLEWLVLVLVSREVVLVSVFVLVLKDWSWSWSRERWSWSRSWSWSWRTCLGLGLERGSLGLGLEGLVLVLVFTELVLVSVLVLALLVLTTRLVASSFKDLDMPSCKVNSFLEHFGQFCLDTNSDSYNFQWWLSLAHLLWVLYLIHSITASPATVLPLYHKSSSCWSLPDNLPMIAPHLMTQQELI